MSFLKLMNVSEGKNFDNLDMSALISDIEAAAVIFGEIASDSALKIDERNQDRSRLLGAAKNLVEALEDPRKTALKIAKGVGSAGNLVGKTWLTLFDRIGVTDAVSAGTLAEATDSEKVLIGECFKKVANRIIAML
ncbi:MAG: hypothetical protein Q9191_002473 [Dirinaria sp. TL-2023a]